MICYLSYIVLRYTELSLKSKGLNYGVETLIRILCEVEKWILKNSKTKQKYMIFKELSKEAKKIYQAFDIQRQELAYRLENT